MTNKNSLVPTGAGPHCDFDPTVFIFRSLQVTEAVAFGDGARACISLFGEIFQRDADKPSGMRRVCSGRVEFNSAERDGAPIGRFSFPPDIEVQPFLLALVDILPSAMPGLIETLRSGPGVELAFRAELQKSLSELAADEQELPGEERGASHAIRTVSVSVSR